MIQSSPIPARTYVQRHPLTQYPSNKLQATKWQWYEISELRLTRIHERENEKL